jgi:hypothetical protein
LYRIIEVIPEAQHQETFEKCSFLLTASRRPRALAGEGENLNPPYHHRDRQEYLEYFED